MWRWIVPIAVLLIGGALVQSVKAAEDVKEDGLLHLAELVGNQPGEISDGHCKCKDRCEVGLSTFSEGRTVAACQRKCQQAFSGCTKGEVRSTQRRAPVLVAGSTLGSVPVAPSRGPLPQNQSSLQRARIECYKQAGGSIYMYRGKAVWGLHSEHQIPAKDNCLARIPGQGNR